MSLPTVLDSDTTNLIFSMLDTPSKWCIRHSCKYYYETFVTKPLTTGDIAKCGYINILEFAREFGCSWDEDLSYIALSNGHKDLFVWAEEHGYKDYDSDFICRAAVEYGSFELLKWLAMERGFKCNKYVFHKAALLGNIEILKWAKWYECNWTSYTCAFAAQGGQLETLEWLIENGCPVDKHTLYYAADGGQIEILVYMKEMNYAIEFDEVISVRAAENGQLEVLKWLKENNYPCDQYASIYANEKGFADVAEWIKNNFV